MGGKGNAGVNGGPNGDFHVYVSVRPHPVFERRGNDVWCEMPITFTPVSYTHLPSVWRQALEQNGEGLHHVAFHIEGMEEMIRRGESQGMKLLQRGRWATGHYAYLDAAESLHVVIELLENGQFEV